MRYQPFRITALWAKAAFIVVGWYLLPWVLRSLMVAGGVPEPVIIVGDIVFGLATVAIGTRAFRARGEPELPPRVWWRATGRPPAGFVIASLLALSIVATLVRSPDLGALWWTFAVSLPLAMFYLQSSIRLVRGGAPVPPRPRRDEDARLLDTRRRF